MKEDRVSVIASRAGMWVNFRGDECMFCFFLSPESAPVDVASIQNQPARKWTDRLIQKGVCRTVL